MRARFSELLADASGRGGAVGAFTCYNLETAAGVVEAVEAQGRSVILLVSEQSFGDLLVSALVAVADRARVPACVQLDHVSGLASIKRAFELGSGAAMVDAEDPALVRAAAAMGEVEAELGGIEGDEDVATAVAAGALTDPEEAAKFVAETGATCFAVSIGNVHGTYREPPALDWARLEAIRERLRVPLSLHGASGLSDEDVRKAVSLGIAKVNVNTELRERYLAATEEWLPGVRDGARLLELNQAQVKAVAELVTSKLAVLG
jgi:tagatose 1,6-diphosphate aldolase GatY/KbaY